MTVAEAASKSVDDADRRLPVRMNLEVVVIPVSDVDRAKRFYGETLGWRLDGDFDLGPKFRLVQYTPPGSGCSVHFGRGVTSAEPGSVQDFYLVVTDIETARAGLVARGVAVSDVFHRDVGGPSILGRHPDQRTYASYATFSDPDGNRWLLQEVTARLPGRVESDQP